MPEFADIKNVYTPKRPLNEAEIIRAIKFALASEYEAVQIYEEIMESTDNEDVKKVLAEISHDERLHAGGLHKLLMILSPQEVEAYEEGAKETMEQIES